MDTNPHQCRRNSPRITQINTDKGKTLVRKFGCSGFGVPPLGGPKRWAELLVLPLIYPVPIRVIPWFQLHGSG
jgi:hypothetical protein